MFDLSKKELLKTDKVCLKIKVRVSASKTIVKDILDDGTIKIDVAAVPEKDKANKELLKYLMREFSVAKDEIKIISGRKDKFKIVSIIRNYK